MTIAITHAAEIAERIQQTWRADLEASRRTPTPHPYVYASSCRECERRMVYEMTTPDQQTPVDADVLAKMRRGEDRERDNLADLARIARNADPPFRVTNQQERFELRGRGGRIVIVGRVDARLELGRVRAPIELKAWSPFLTERIKTFDDVFTNRWTTSGGYQMLAYLYGASESFGFLLLDGIGVPRLLPVELDPHLDKVETFLSRAEHALEHVDAGTLPDYLNGDPDECTRCPFYGGTCNPPLSGVGDLQVLNDPELEAALDRREELRKPGKAYAELDQEIKQRLRGVTHAIVGPYEIRGYWGKQSRLDLPLDVVARNLQLTIPQLRDRYTRTDPHGRFTLHIEKHG